jgi:putative ABC transport system substrate-binding protein
MKKLIAGIVIVLIVLAITGGYFLLAPKRNALQGKVFRVGILSGLNLFAGIADSFKEEMTKLGYTEGTNITYDVQKTNFEPEKEKQILTKFVADKVDLIFGFNTEVALEIKQAIKGTDIPGIFANAITESIGSNLIESVRAPGGNITGVRYPNTDVAVKRLDILHEIAPNATRIWLPYQKDYPTVPAELAVIYPEAKALGVTITEFPSANLTALENELVRLTKSGNPGFDAVLLIPESLSTTKEAFAIIAKYTKNAKIPIGGSSITTDDYGTIFAVTVDNKEIGKLSARQADKVLRGAKAGAVPVVSPESILILNNKVAQLLGIRFNEGLMGKANQIIR